MAEPVDLVVYRAVFFDIGVAGGDVRLGLVIVVVADEVLNPVLREYLPHLVGELGGEGLVGCQDQGGPLHSLDRPGDGRALAAARDAEQRLEPVSPENPFGQSFDGVGLVAGGRPLGHDFERRHGGHGTGAQ